MIISVLNDKFTLPLKDPVLIFSVVLFIILFAPILLKKIKIPSIVGLIIAGVIVGPNGFNVLERSDSIILFGTVGILYIMFLAGLEINLSDIKKTGTRSLIFGLLTFSIPLAVGYWVSSVYMGLNIESSLLLGSMFSTHTLLAYPIASRLGIAKNESVGVVIGGTIVTDTLALLMLTVIVSAVSGNLGWLFFIQLALSFSLFTVFTLLIIPKISRWFFILLKGESSLQYIFVLAMVFLAGFVAELAGVEPIIGAFLAGLAFNRLIPHTSQLMNRIEFVGNALFIPFFLISTGMIVNYKVLLSGDSMIYITISLLLLVSVSSKYIASFISQLLFKYTSQQRNVMFGLSSAHAAATLAIISIGYKLGMFDEVILNGAIILILVSCLFSSFITEHFGRKLAITMSSQVDTEPLYSQRILVPLANPLNAQPLVDLAIMIKFKDSNEPIFPLTIVKDDDSAIDAIAYNNQLLDSVKVNAARDDIPVQVVSRVDLNISHGIERAVKELMITEIIIGWGKNTALEAIFGNLVESLLLKTEQMIIVSRLFVPVSEIQAIHVLVPPYCELEKGFRRWVRAVSQIGLQYNRKISFYGLQSSLDRIQNLLPVLNLVPKSSFELFNSWENFTLLTDCIYENDLFIVISARQRTISYQTFMAQYPELLSTKFLKINSLLIYPEQHDIRHYDSILQFDGLSSSPIQDNIERINKIRKSLTKSLFGEDIA